MKITCWKMLSYSSFLWIIHKAHGFFCGGVGWGGAWVFARAVALSCPAPHWPALCRVRLAGQRGQWRTTPRTALCSREPRPGERKQERRGPAYCSAAPPPDKAGELFGSWAMLYVSFLKTVFLFIYLFIYWLLWVFVALRSLSLVEASGDYSLL